MGYEYEITDPRVRSFVELVVRPNVLAIRIELAKKHDVKDPESWYVNYNNLCIDGTAMLIKRMKQYRKQWGIDKRVLSAKAIHGEQKPHPRLKMDNWATEHEWAVIRYLGVDIYVDVTCGQFVDFYRDAPAYYISTKPPKWFIPDAENDAVGREWNRKEKIMGFFFDRIGWLLGMQVPEEKE